jgi:hypothetical protein
MKEVQKFTSFSELKDAEEISSKRIDSNEIKHFIELLRQGKMPVENKTR